MIPDGYASLQTAFTKLAEQEGRENGRGPDVPNVAAARLHFKLVTGELQAFRCDLDGVVTPVAVHEWKEEADTFYRSVAAHKTYTDVFCRADDLRTMLDRRDSSVAPVSAGPVVEAAAKAKRGRPEFDREQLCVAVAITTYEDPPPKTQDAMVLNIQAVWADLYGEDNVPSETTLNPIVRAIFKARRARNTKIQK